MNLLYISHKMTYNIFNCRTLKSTLKHRSRHRINFSPGRMFSWMMPDKKNLENYSNQVSYIRTIPTLEEISIGNHVNDTDVDPTLSLQKYGYINPPYELKFRRDTYINGIEDDDFDDYGIG